MASGTSPGGRRCGRRERAERDLAGRNLKPSADGVSREAPPARDDREPAARRGASSAAASPSPAATVSLPTSTPDTVAPGAIARRAPGRRRRRRRGAAATTRSEGGRRGAWAAKGSRGRVAAVLRERVRGAVVRARAREELVEQRPGRRRAARPVSTPRCPPGAVSSRTGGACGSRSPDVMAGGDRRDPVARPAIASTGTRTPARSSVAPAELEPARRRGRWCGRTGGRAGRSPPRVRVHALHERVDRLDLRQQLAVVEVG